MFFFIAFRKVHVTKQTLDLLDDQYIYEDGTLAARDDSLLQRNGIVTYLISPQYLAESNVNNNCHIFVIYCNYHKSSI